LDVQVFDPVALAHSQVARGKAIEIRLCRSRSLGCEGLDEEQDVPNVRRWLMAVLPITAQDAERPIAFDTEAAEKFNAFYFVLKAKRGGELIDLVDYDAGKFAR
jgi:hypothetical protein